MALERYDLWFIFSILRGFPGPAGLFETEITGISVQSSSNDTAQITDSLAFEDAEAAMTV